MERESSASLEVTQRVRWFAAGLAVTWTVVFVAAGIGHVEQERQLVQKIATAQARTSFERDQVLRQWASSHGGVYVRSQRPSDADPHLADGGAPVIETARGETLVLLGPTSVLHQLRRSNPALFGVQEHILEPADSGRRYRTDSVEGAALAAFQNGTKEIARIEQVDGKAFLRLLRPVVAEPGCLGCHGTRRVSAGQPWGVAAVSVPLQPLIEQQRATTRIWHLSLGLLWMLGLVGIGLGARHLGRAVRRQELGQQELRVAYGRLDATLDALPDMLLEVDRHRHLLDLRTTDPELLPVPAEGGIGRPIDEVLPPEIAAATGAAIDECTRSGQSRGMTAALPRQGAERWLELSAAASDPGTTDGRFVVLIRDVTRRALAEQELRASEVKHRTLFEEAIDGIALADPESGVIADCNKALAGLLGRARVEIVGSQLQCLLPIIGAKGSRSMLAACDEQDGQLLETRITTVKGEPRDVEIKTSLVELDSGRLLLAIIRDISARRIAEADLERLGRAVEQTSDVIMITDRQGTISYVNPAFERVTGYTHEQAIGQNPRLLKSGTHNEDFYRELWQTIAKGETWTGNLVIRRRDGSQLTEEATISPVRSTSGDIISYVAVKRDISEKLELEAQLRQAQRMEAIGQLAGGVAHDFNNMLHAMMGYIEVAMTKLPANAPALSDLEQVLRAGEKTARLTRQLLAFSRRQVLELTDLDLNDVVADLMKLIRRVIGEHIVLDVVPGFDLGTIRADRSQIEQVIMNLALNARDAMANGGRITIKAENVVLDGSSGQGWAGGPVDTTVNREEHDRNGEQPAAEVTDNRLDLAPARNDAGAAAQGGAYVMLSISDTGCGMDELTLGRAFEPFFTTKDQGHGTGLGLAMVYGIVRQHGGTIHCSSAPGQGATFRIYLPQVQPSDPDEQHASHEAVAGGTETILVAEDDAMVRGLTERILSHAGYTVLTATNGEEAIALFQVHRSSIDLALLDVVMPKIGGPAVIQDLHRYRPSLPVVLTSGYPPETAPSGGSGTLGTPFLAKPFSAGDLLQMVRTLLDQHS